MRVGISFKLIVAVAAVLVATIGAFSYFLTASQHRALVAEIEHSAHRISETIKSATKDDMLLNRRERLHRTIDTLGRQEGIEQVRIFNKDGEIIYSSDPAAIGTLVDKRGEACYACHTADRPLERLSVPERTRIFDGDGRSRQLGIINPIYSEPGCWQASCHVHDASQTVLGVLDVTQSLAEVDDQLLASWLNVFLLALTATLASSLIIWFVLHRVVGRPVGRLVQATREVADGDLSCRVKPESNDELGHLAGCFNDMTLKIAETQQQLYQSEKLASLGRLSAGVAHEINNPLTGVLTYSSYLLKKVDDPETREDLETIVRETKRCRQIVRELLDFSRQTRPRTTRVELSDVIGKALRIVHNRLSFDNIAVSTRVGAGVPPIAADPNQMVQVLINLVVNAADAIGNQGGEISIEARRRVPHGANADVEIVVADTGCGIDPENIGKVFEPFYTTKNQEGTGLGLSVVWGIVDKHGGKVDIRSEPGRGTRVTLRMPAFEDSLIREKTA